MQRTAAEARLRLRSQIRKNHIQDILAAGRQQLTTALEDAHFLHLTSSMDACAFRTHLSTLVGWANSERYGHRLVALAGFAYEELVRCPEDAEVLRLLGALAEFDELELPHTKQLAGILVDSLQQRPVESLSVAAQVLANAQTDRFAHFLLERGFLEMAEQTAGSGDYQRRFLWADALSSLLRTRPSLPLPAIHAISCTLACTADCQTSLLVVDSLAKISQFSQKDAQLSHLLLQNLGQLCLKQYPEQTVEVCSFYHYCILSGSPLRQREVQLLADSFQNKREDCRLAILRCLSDLCKSEALSQSCELEDTLHSTALPYKVLQLYESSSFPLKKQSIVFLQLALPSFIDLAWQHQATSPLDLAAAFEIFMWDALSLPDSPSQQTALRLLLSVLLTLWQMEVQERQPFLAGISGQSVENWLCERSLCQTKQGAKTMKKIEAALEQLRK